MNNGKKMKSKSKGLKYMFSGTWPQVLAVLSCTVSAIGDGMQYGWSAPIIPILERPDSPVKITETDKDWIENIYLMGGIFGVPITIYLVDKIGRKYSVIAAGLLNLAAWILTAIASKSTLLLIARFMTGIAGDVAFVAAPMYIAEIADQKIRGFLATLIYTMMLVGIFLIYAIGPYVSVFVSSCVGASFLIIQLLTFPFMPETPYYYLCKGKFEKARRSLVRLRVNPDVDKEMGEMKAAIERQKSESGRPQDLIMEKSNRKAVIIMVVLNGAQHLSSISVMLMNMHMILSSAGSIYIETNYAAMLFSALMMVAAIVAGLVCDRFGRKILLISSSILTGAVLLTLAIFFHLKQTGFDVDSVSWIPVFCVLSYALFFKFGLGIIPIVLTAELFPAKVKAMGMSIADALYLTWALISVYLFLYTSRAFGMAVPFYIFAFCAFGSAAFCAWVVPETKGRTLEEIQMILKGIPVTRASLELIEMSKSKQSNLNNKEASPESVAFLEEA
ncbi:facilitated trehalose transporter Tret1-like [Coccinella septempunctata]|uniref:facilitated trehalose transporter Tret1-like n=1 Tax=Coccinella septempunctata TaxID=41139 RepID=UPI001D0979D6|nr:facilitated trehalose transporter Tret1-like [Coccinella septempunctata]XP_044754292.1 facilitated trehalose transporter Tret1-like [Coccinella septempunctata]XP_044754293.1 facilitated trehalose transporter Tret1-like [Coccinella septempunctata]